MDLGKQVWFINRLHSYRDVAFHAVVMIAEQTNEPQECTHTVLKYTPHFSSFFHPQFCDYSVQQRSRLTEEEQEKERMGGLPGERCPEEARLGGEAVKRSHQMCWHVMITPGCSRVRGLMGRLSLWLTSAGLFIISYSQDDGASTLLLLIWSLHTCKSLCTDRAM